ncbi:MAG: hypothetical protein ABEJ58_06760 [Halodesulfurarchaeum sp.]
MAGRSDERLIERTDAGASTLGSEGSVSDRNARSGVLSRSDRLRVFLSTDSEESREYHTSRLCTDFPVPAKSVSRTEAESDGYTFCWQCFELEMQSLADR